jgi:hypothetical protein
VSSLNRFHEEPDKPFSSMTWMILDLEVVSSLKELEGGVSPSGIRA